MEEYGFIRMLEERLGTAAVTASTAMKAQRAKHNKAQQSVSNEKQSKQACSKDTSEFHNIASKQARTAKQVTK